MRKAFVAIVVLLVIAAVSFGVRTLGSRDETDAVDATEASRLVERDDEPGADEAHAAGRRPQPGTYTYEGSGTESVSALGGSTHEFPATIPVVVKLDPEDDCRWTSNVIFVEQHVEERRFCTDEQGVLDLGFTRRIEFFNQLQTARYDCGDNARRLDLAAAAGATTTWKCVLDEEQATSAYTATSLGKERQDLGGEQVETWHVKVTSKQTGATRGSDTSEFWYLETGQPVRFTGTLDVDTDSVLGETRFQERFDYRLASLVPERP